MVEGSDWPGKVCLWSDKCPGRRSSSATTTAEKEDGRGWLGRLNS